ncbi:MULTISPECIES: hypothetical protein [Maritimibacter]|jgi:hypothetical protein|uniref:Uncharacterized protein n=1 Tax=Maritimibacter alkaliphilus HTCC2654 TaxID=314271 RepID=A3VDR1_9RHOB|nr:MULTISPECIES: hypothetical protein [Maritimibacter]EAQ13650.1 hypothetical protein RB2654_03014 [Maritimibacter alkaliphilus HTCC2654]MBL6429769.1 hypothetical protein [Maritimibacter sp.]TYP83487.1 hypothetical protein BD830_103524 [Maritimibacter alkaliphilus HTCC2654]
MATYKDPRIEQREPAASRDTKAKQTERKAEAEAPKPKPVITDWAAI